MKRRGHRRDDEPAGRHRLGSAYGFTLTELVVTITLVAMLATIASPSIMRAMERADARQVAREIANTFRTARHQAMSRSEVVLARVEMTADDGSGRITLHRTDNNTSSCSTATTTDTTEIETLEVAQFSGERIMHGKDTAAPDWICFAPDGRVLDMDGQIIMAQEGGCTGKNFRMWTADREATIESNHKRCARSEEERRTSRDARDMINMWIIHVPFNGSVEAHP